MTNSPRSRSARTATGQLVHHGRYLITGYRAEVGARLKAYSASPELAAARAAIAEDDGYTNVQITELED